MASGGNQSISLDELLERADIIDVAHSLRLQVDRKPTRPRRALCPFHNDTTPSLNLYEGRHGDTPHYHCFSCGAHGDLIDLIREVKGISFLDATRWLAESLGISDFSTQTARVETREATAALTHLIAHSHSSRFKAFCDSRGYSEDFLMSRGVGAVSLNELIERARKDKAFAEPLIEAGIARRVDITTSQDEFWRDRISGFFGGERVVFQIDSAHGGVAGFAARAFGDEVPKYLYTSRFPRRETLYGAADVLRDLQFAKDIQGTFALYVVEGILDALRLTSLGIPAVAVLGSSLTAEQAVVLGRILTRAREKFTTLRLQLFLDPDEAGRKGTFTSISHLMKLQVEHGPFDIHITAPTTDSGSKNDPDAFLRGMSREEALEALKAVDLPALVFLANHLMRRPVDARFSDSSAGSRAMAARRIVESVDRTGLQFFLEQFKTPDEWAPFIDSLHVFMQVHPAASRSGTTKERIFTKAPPEGRSAILRALSLGRSTMLRREYPFDDAAWDRLSVTASALYHVHSARLAHDYGPSAPYLARHVPKSDGRMRLKCGPVAEDLLLQLYVMQDLLRSHAAADLIPAVRSDADGRAIQTGPQSLRDGKLREAVSFAYQIDMAIADRIATPDRAGLFRSYFACWRDFIEHIDRRLARTSHEIVHVARLDISGFYDNVRRLDVQAALQSPLRQACERLDALGEPLAPLLAPTGTPAERADAILDFLVQHSFGYLYTDPESGVERYSAPDRGLPQGPDLSAYLANVVLFDLDAMMVEEIEALDSTAREASGRADACGGAYARYVDDLVLVCPDGATLRRLQRRIEAFLGKMGLRLNRKNSSPPPMSRREARQWVTANRTGFGFSGPISEMLPIAFFDPLTDAGDIPVDRKLALGLLHDPSLDNGGIYVRENGDSAADDEKRANALTRLKSALSAKELRYNDRISAYRRLWLMATADATEAAIARRFIELVLVIEDREERPFSVTEARSCALAIYDAMERVMRIELSLPDAENVDRQTFVRLRNKLAASHPHQLADAAAAGIFSKTNPESTDDAQAFLKRFDVAAHRLVIVNAAFAQLPNLNEPAVDANSITRGIPPSWFGSLWTTLRRHTGSVAAGKEDALVERDDLARTVFATLHQDIVAIKRWAARAGEKEGEERSTAPQFGPLGGDAASPLLTSTNAIRSVWLGTNIAIPEEPHRDAAAALVNLAANRLNDVFENWPALLSLLLGKESDDKFKAIPQPPGLQLNAALLIDAFKSEKRKLTLVEFDIGSEEEVEDVSGSYPRAVVGINWPVEPNYQDDKIRIYEAELDGFEPMEANDRRQDSPAATAATYRGLFCSLPSPGPRRQLIPTAYSFFNRQKGETTEYRVIAWTARDTAANGHAFVRYGDGLQVVEVPERDAPLWRFGWAVCDLFDHVDFVREKTDAEGDTSIAHLTLIAHAIIRRTMHRLVGPDTFGAGAASQEPGKPPSRIERALQLLEAHDAVQDDPAGASTISAAAFAQGVMLHERIENSGLYWCSGGLAALLRRAAQRGARGLRRAAENWADEPVLDPIGLRRGVAAWLSIGERLSNQADKLSPVVRSDLAPLIAGCRLEGIATGLRRLALDLIAQCGAEALNGLDALKPDPDDLQSRIDFNLVLVESGEEEDIEIQIDSLRDSLASVVANQEPAQAITPLGWAVLVGTLLNVLPRTQTGADLLRPRAPVGVQENEAARQALGLLIGLVALRSKLVNEDGGDPQDIFLPYVEVDANQWSEARAALLTLDTAAKLKVETIESASAPFDRRQTDAVRPTLILPDRREFVISPWCINRTNLQGDSSAPEARLEGSQRVLRYSAVSSDGTVLSVDLVSIQFAATAFGPAIERPQIEGSKQHVTTTAVIGAVPGTQASAHQNQAADSTNLSQPNADIKFRMIEQRNLSSWRERRNSPGMHRVALLQWDVCDTYQFPEDNDARHEGLVHWDKSEGKFILLRNQKPGNRMDLSGKKVISIQEFRRREILKSALAACNAFRVEGLVLPEYSVRPETVNWLARRLTENEYPYAVWAGTFRVPSGQTLALDSRGPKYRHGNAADQATKGDTPDYSAVIPCVYKQPADPRGFERPSNSPTHVLIQDRLKRLPSVAVDELIRPMEKEWAPLFAETFWGHMHLQSFAAELVCSEIFLHASSGNIPGAIAAAMRLQDRLGIKGNAKDIQDEIIKEIQSFSSHTSFQEWTETQGRHNSLQRTVLIVPAMTSRSADYHIFGQNHHLASGLMTVFANAVCDGVGNGESCFIGLDSWNEMGVKDSPYGDVGPGIFHFRRDGFGPLGTKEAAMVIADIDPIHSTDHKPRPHFQPRPLRLVAHLPLIFATRFRKGSVPLEKGDYPSGNRVVRREVVDPEKPAPTFAEAISEDRLDDERALKVLELFADDAKWLSKRREAYQKKGHLYPNRAIPFPALADWIFVNDAWPTDQAIVDRLADETRWTDDDPWLEFPERS